MDQIRIRELKVYAYHGYYEEEKQKGQHFIINATLYLSLQKAGTTDDLQKTVNYAKVCNEIVCRMQEKKVDLIETVAEELAVALLDIYPQVSRVDMEVRKPEAPIDADFQYVSVMVSRKRHQAYIAFGSNQGDSKTTIRKAIDMLNQEKGCKVKKVSELLVSSPYGGVEQDDFYNGALLLETYLEAPILLETIHRIESALGRTREVHWGPRTIDLDIIFYDHIIMDEEQLIIPHPDMYNRDFVLKPIAELCPNYRHPVLHKTVKEMLEELTESYIKE